MNYEYYFNIYNKITREIIKTSLCTDFRIGKLGNHFIVINTAADIVFKQGIRWKRGVLPKY